MTHFSGQCGVILVYSGSFRRDLQEPCPLSYGISGNVHLIEKKKIESVKMQKT
jgi:hypothetical protein